MMHWYNNLKRSKKKSFYLLWGLVLITIIMAIYFNQNNSSNIFNIILKEPYYFITSLFYKDNNNYNNNNNKDYQALEGENMALKNEIKALQELLDVDSLITDYDKISATVISRKRMDWYNTLVINKGSSSGLVEGLAVIDGQGLIGKITLVTPHTSTIKLLTNNLKVSVLITTENEEIYGVLSYYDPTNHCFVIEGISDIVDIKMGAKVMTTGLSEIFSKGLMIGMVKNIKLDSFGLSRIVEVTPSVNYNNISFVTVLKKKT